MNKIFAFVIFSLILFILTEKCHKNNKCTVDNKERTIYCNNFNSFEEIQLECVNISQMLVERLVLEPDKRLIVDRSLDLSKISFNYLIFFNILGFELNDSPLVNNQHKKFRISVSNSEFNFYRESLIIDETNKCLEIKQKSIFVNATHLFLNDVSIKIPICQNLFRNARIEEFRMTNLHIQTEHLFDDKNEISEIDCSINFLYLDNSNLKINYRNMPEALFKRSTNLDFHNSFNTLLENESLKNFKSLKYFYFYFYIDYDDDIINISHLLKLLDTINVDITMTNLDQYSRVVKYIC